MKKSRSVRKKRFGSTLFLVIEMCEGCELPEVIFFFAINKMVTFVFHEGEVSSAQRKSER